MPWLVMQPEDILKYAEFPVFWRRDGHLSGDAVRGAGSAAVEDA